MGWLNHTCIGLAFLIHCWCQFMASKKWQSLQGSCFFVQCPYCRIPIQASSTIFSWVGFVVCYLASFFVVSYHAIALLYVSAVCFLRWSTIDRFLWTDDYPGSTSIGKLDEPNETLETIRPSLLKKSKDNHSKKKPDELFLGL